MAFKTSVIFFEIAEICGVEVPVVMINCSVKASIFDKSKIFVSIALISSRFFFY